MSKNSIKIQEAPIFLEFLKKLFEKLDEIESSVDYKNFNIEDDFVIIDYCKCGQKNCATVNLQYKQKFDEELLGSYCYNTNKGLLISHFLEDGLFELEAVGYNFYPYKTEIYNLFNKNQRRLNKKKFKSIDSYLHISQTFFHSFHF